MDKYLINKIEQFNKLIKGKATMKSVKGTTEVVIDTALIIYCFVQDKEGKLLFAMIDKIDKHIFHRSTSVVNSEYIDYEFETIAQLLVGYQIV